MTGRGCGHVVGDDKAGEWFGGSVLCTVAQPVHIPTIAVRGERLRGCGSGRIEDVPTSECELGKLGF